MLEVNNNVEIKSGLEWIKAAFRIFREKPVHFILLTIVYYIFVGLLPFLGPLFAAKFANLTLKVEKNEEVLIDDLYMGFFSNINVLKLSILNAMIFLAVLVLKSLVASNLSSDSISVAGFNVNFYAEAINIIPMLILGLCMWFAPLICLFNPDITPFKAMLLSLKGCGSNILAFLIFFLISMALLILATIPVCLGWFVLLPTINIATFFIYRSIFITPAEISDK
jgi:hypothetical protein